MKTVTQGGLFLGLFVVILLLPLVMYCGYSAVAGWQMDRQLDQQVNQTAFQHRYRRYFERHDQVNARHFKTGHRQVLTSLSDSQGPVGAAVDYYTGALNHVWYGLNVKTIPGYHHWQIFNRYRIVGLKKYR
ncbi:hypothetical protein D1831_12290 [Lactiplantibacillus garii]|uniref:Uncharacterized protein n=1 Tax=Lactiplantibacillus garii TaxID=2306423 RepID=A0A426D4M5_9LACO|nr:hypothetical protein [Lactiplantibacillus garii]RRK09530.1 hypothetical protein D1831_12290 [Lactiplantibacillus garii]